MKTLPRRIIRVGVIITALAATTLPVQAWAPKAPPHKEFKDPLTPYKKTLSTSLGNFNKSLSDLIKGIKDGSAADPLTAYQDLSEALFEAMLDGVIDLDTALGALIAAHPEDSIDGDPGGDLARLTDVAQNLVQCVAAAALDKLQALEKVKNHPMLITFRIFDVFVEIPIPVAAGVVKPPKRVSVAWYAAGRDVTPPMPQADDTLRFGGQAPAGTTVDVTVDCGPGHVTVIPMVPVDSKCRWKVHILGGVPPGGCQITAVDHNDAANKGSRAVSVP